MATLPTRHLPDGLGTLKTLSSRCGVVWHGMVWYYIYVLSQQLCTDGMAAGWTKFKIKVGADIEDDKRRCKVCCLIVFISEVV